MEPKGKKRCDVARDKKADLRHNNQGIMDSDFFSPMIFLSLLSLPKS